MSVSLLYYEAHGGQVEKGNKMATVVVNAGKQLNLDAVFGNLVEWEKYGQKGHFALGTFSPLKLAANPRTYKGVELHDFFGFGGWTAEGVGRLVQDGEMVQGPHAYLVEHGVYLSAHAQPDDVAFLVEVGSELTFAGTTYKVVKNVYRGLELEVVG